MAARKKTPANALQNPFKSLKGFCVSTPTVATPQPPPRPAAVSEPEPDFVDEMARYGVKRLAVPESPPPAAKPTPVETVSYASAEEREQAEFLAALGPLNTVFRDELPEDEPLTQASPRRLKQLRQGRLQPQATLDLHGATRAEALAKVRHFLANAGYHGLTLVLIVTGWGKSGSGEAVLREEVIRYLRAEGSALVSEWTIAPRPLGGDGALLAFLRKRAQF